MAKKEKPKKESSEEEKKDTGEKGNKTEHEEGKKKKPEKKNKFSWKKKILIVIGFLVLLLAACFLGLYVYSPLGKITRPVFKELPFPVAIVGNGKELITSSELISNVDAVRKFYESQDYSKLGLRVDFSTKEGKNRLKVKEKDVFDKMIEDRIVSLIAKERGIEVTTEEAQKAIDEKVKEAGDKRSLELSLESLYGWSIEEFRDKVVTNQLYMEKLFGWYASTITQQKEFKKIEKAKQDLDEDGSNFDEVAREYSEGESAKNDGEIGWFSLDELVQEVSEVVFEMDEGEMSDIIISPLGYHIVQVQEIKRSETEEGGSVSNNGNKEVRLRQVFVKGKSFLNWLVEKKKEAQVIVLMKDYRWDANEGRIRFVNEKFEKMEKKLRIKADGDPSI